MLIVQWQGNIPIDGFVQFYFSSGEIEARDFGPPGILEIPELDGQRPYFARMNFYGPIWSGAITSFSKRPVHFCCGLGENRNWWRDLVGRGIADPGAGQGIKIGILDTPFAPSGCLSHVRCIDLEGRPARNVPWNKISHGRVVAEILAASAYDGNQEGIAPAAEIVALDISLRDDPTEVDYDRFAAGIETLSFDHGCDLVNLSAGAEQPVDAFLFEESTTQLRAAVNAAFENGTLVIAAVGNENLDACAIPACFENVVGVGSIAACGIGPEGSLLRHFEETRRTQGLVGVIGDVKVFPVPETVSGSGLNAVAPGAGIFVTDGSGVLQEFEGTSFASPIVVGVLASALAVDKSYGGKRGRARSEHALGVLRELCRDLKLPEKYQGWGLPILHSRPI